MAARSKARKRALDVLYAAEVRGAPVLDLLAEQITLDSPPVPPYAASLVRGVVSHQERIDSLLSSHAEGWTLSRMPAVDRNILRIGVFELLWADDVPDGVVLSEATEMATDLSTDASPAFVNGLLARLADLKPTLDLSPSPAADATPAPDTSPASPPAAEATTPEPDRDAAAAPGPAPDLAATPEPELDREVAPDADAASPDPAPAPSISEPH